jgi:signal transduction histidine kinase
MTRAEALAALSAEEIDVRLRGARFMALNARRADLARLQALLRTENVRWVKVALERGVERASRSAEKSGQAPIDQPVEPSPEVIRDVQAEAVEEVAGTIIHEFAPIVGLLRVQARREIPSYEASKSKGLLDMLSALMRGVRELKTAASVPHYEDIELSPLVSEARDMLDEPHREIVALGGPSPFHVFADRVRLLLAVGNGLRNAVEAALANQETIAPSVVVNWGRAGNEDWLAIIDTGPGFMGNPAAALRIGATNKADHIGFGLATAQQAMRTMEGDVYLSNNEKGGATFELRWFRSDAHPVR